MKKVYIKIIAAVVILMLLIIVVNIFFTGTNYITSDGDFAQLFWKYYRIDDIDAEQLTERKGCFAESIDGYEKVLEIDDMEVVYNSNTLERIYIVVKNSDTRFGDENVGIGDEKAKIDKIFQSSKRPKPSYDSFAYYDNSGNSVITETDMYCDDEYQLSVGFEYDDEDKVKVIYIGYGPNN